MTDLIGWVELPIAREDLLFTWDKSNEVGGERRPRILLRASAFGKIVAAYQQAQQGAEMLGRLGKVIAARDAERAEPSKHEFVPGHSGMTCTAMVMRDGGGDACGMGPAHTIHITDASLSDRPYCPSCGTGSRLGARVAGIGCQHPWHEAKPVTDVHSEAELAAVRDHVGEELPGMWEPTDLYGGQSDAEPTGAAAVEQVVAERRTGLYDALNLWASRNPGMKLPPGRYLIGNSGEILPDRINPRRLLKFSVREDGAVVNSSGQPAITPSEYGKAIPERERSRLRPRPVRDAPQA